jgi:hypothetical protein
MVGTPYHVHSASRYDAYNRTAREFCVAHPDHSAPVYRQRGELHLGAESGKVVAAGVCWD